MWNLFSLAPRCGLLFLIIYAPAAMGSVPDWAETVLVQGCYVVAALHFIDFLSRRGWEKLPWIPLAFLGAILLQGWLMASNAKYLYVDPIDRLVPLAAFLNHWPGAFDREAALHLMNRLTAFSAIFVVMLDLSRDPTWRRWALTTMALTGMGLIAFGLSEVATQWSGMWPQYGHNVWPFATYFYHGNAGAFINLVFPLIVAFVARAFFFAVNPWWRSLWALGLVIAVAGAFVNASKAAQAVFVILILLSFLPWFRLMRKKLFTRAMMLRAAIVLPIFMVAMAAVLYFGDVGQAIARWTLALNQTMMVSSGRLGVAHVCLRLIPQGGLWGFGPGCFTTLFPYATRPEGWTLWGFWRFAHEDYLQTLVEWGYVGTLFWSLFFFGGMASAFYQAARPLQTMRLRTRILLGAIGCSLFGCGLHALVDFPLQIASLEFYCFLLLAMGWGSWCWPKEGRPHR